MNTFIVCSQRFKGNTQKLAAAMATVLNAQVKQPQDASLDEVLGADLVGFGSGIFFGNHDEGLLTFVDDLPSGDKNVFIFSTRGRNSFFESRYHHQLKEKLIAKGYRVVGEYSCRGFSDYYKIFKLFGGVNKGHPTTAEIEKAKTFAAELIAKVGDEV